MANRSQSRRVDCSQGSQVLLAQSAWGHVVKVAEQTDRQELMGCPQAPVGGRWSFEAAGYLIHSEDVGSEGDAAAELCLVQRKLYPEGCEKDHG